MDSELADRPGKQGARPIDLNKEPPEFVKHRLSVLEAVKARRQEEYQARVSESIDMVLPDGKVVQAQSFVTTPFDVAVQIVSEQKAKTWVAARVGEDKTVWDMHRPLETAGAIEFCDFDDPDGKHVFWHSSAHVLGEAMEREFGCDLCAGPPVDQGFYYDVYMHDRSFAVTPDYFDALEAWMAKIVKEKQVFERVEITKEELLDMFKFNPFKLTIINRALADGERTTVYHSGTLIDLCRGPHVPNTSYIKACWIKKSSSSYWQKSKDNESLQRVYGITFPDKKLMKEYKVFLEEAAKRDHRKIGTQQNLWMWHPMSPGSTFFLPHGARIYNKLVAFMRSEYWKRGFDEVVTPNVFHHELWETSGHWQKYKENIFVFECEGHEFGVKPMNCPGHCLMFKSTSRSYRELPIRFADFGVLHRNELSGTLSGMTRVRRFQQDDAHIFCAEEQVEKEMDGALDFLFSVYGVFGFEFELKLATRPENFMGEPALWDMAEAGLEAALNRSGREWSKNDKDGAFYGPKIDIAVKDCLGRQHQCATIQLDFQLPVRFGLDYVSSDGSKKRPVMIHRAILGSVERFMAILCEHVAGKWPFWISPRQVVIVPVSEKHHDYAQIVWEKIHSKGIFADVDVTDNKLPKKIREAQLAQYNFILVVGVEEREQDLVNVRTRANQVLGQKKIDVFVAECEEMIRLHQ